MEKTIESMLDCADEIGRKEGADAALAFLAQCAERVRDEDGDDSLPYAVVLNQLGFVNRSDGRYEAAADFFSQAREVLARVVGTDDPEYATAVMNLAGVERLLGRPSESLGLFEEALQVYRNAYGEESALFLTALNNIALSYQDLGDNAQALRYHLQVCFGLEELCESSPDLVVEYGTSLCNTGMCFRLEGEDQLGRELIERSLQVYDTVLSDDHFLVRQARQMLEGAADAAMSHEGA